jgi:hypothetical protein
MLASVFEPTGVSAHAIAHVRTFNSCVGKVLQTFRQCCTIEFMKTAWFTRSSSDETKLIDIIDCRVREERHASVTKASYTSVPMLSSDSVYAMLLA